MTKKILKCELTKEQNQHERPKKARETVHVFFEVYDKHFKIDSTENARYPNTLGLLLLFGLNFFGPEAQMFFIQIYWKLPKDNLDCSHRNQTRQSTSHSL